MVGFRREIEASDEFRRIHRLQRRTPEISAELSAQLTGLLRTQAGTMALRPVQALALHDIGTTGGLLGPIRVGGGKTLITLLAPYVLGAKRPLLLLPAGLIDKTKRDKRELMRHWVIPRNIRIMSYEQLGRVGAAKELEMYRPDVIVADEAHRLKNKRASCTRRVTRYMHEHPDTKFLAVSGTLMKHSLRDFGPLAAWSLKDGAPIPLEWGELEAWADALDEKVNPLTRVRPGVLGADVDSARRWFHDRLVATPGVVSSGGDVVSCSLYISALEHPVNPITEANFQMLRNDWCTPDGWAYASAVDVWRHARELALGLHYVWDPRPPQEWLDARKDWAAFARTAIKDSSHSNTPLDSELQVVHAVDGGLLHDGGVLKRWREIKPTFTVNSKPVWHDTAALEACEAWMTGPPGIVWVEHTFFAEELARRTGAPYYGAGGLCGNKQIMDEDGKRTIIASIAANSTGRNLQMFSRNLVTSCCTGADQWEQLLGRTHRDGQQADEVIVDVLFACAEHLVAMRKALADAKMHQDVLGQPQKLLLADLDWPEEITGGPRWTKTSAGSAPTSTLAA